MTISAPVLFKNPTPSQINLIKNSTNHSLLLKKLQNTESAQLCRSSSAVLVQAGLPMFTNINWFWPVGPAQCKQHIHITRSARAASVSYIQSYQKCKHPLDIFWGTLHSTQRIFSMKSFVACSKVLSDCSKHIQLSTGKCNFQLRVENVFNAKICRLYKSANPT